MYSMTHPLELASIHAELLRRQLSLATAESCTGGLLAVLFTELSGSSAYYLGGVASYSNHSKNKWLGVSRDMLSEFGAVSEPVAKQMASGVCVGLGADFGVSLTGIAGPGGGSASKPVGTVWCGLSYHGEVAAYLLECQGDRQAIRSQAMQGAVKLLRSWMDCHLKN